jgi:predicted nucleic acid-binding protein
LLIAGTRTQEARDVWAHDPEWYLPPLWRSEYLNVLAVSVRAGALARPEALLAWRRACTLLSAREVEPEGETVLAVALDAGISAYDAHFVSVAKMLRARLVTADRRLPYACPGIAVSPAELLAR